MAGTAKTLVRRPTATADPVVLPTRRMPRVHRKLLQSQRYRRMASSSRSTTAEASVSDTETRLVEALAALEHDQWRAWAESVLASEEISAERAARWRRFLVPYDELDDDAKEQDRIWARRVLALVKAHPDDAA